MNPLVLMLFAIVGIFTLFIYIASLYKIYEPTEELYEHSRSCENSPISYCVDTKKFYFKQIASQLDYKVVEKEYNEWLHAANQLGKNVFEMRYSPETKKFIAYALEDLKKSENVLTISEKSIFHKLSMSALNFNNQVNLTKLENDQEVMNKMNLTSIPNILIISMIYHIYNLEFSGFRPWILSLTPEISNFFAAMTAYEYNTFIKSNKEITLFVKEYFDSMEKDWKNLEYFIKKKMTPEEIQSFFNGHNFTKTDYIFARSVTERHAWSIANEKDLVLFPGYDNFPRKNIEKDSFYEEFYRQQEVQSISNTSAHFRFFADRNVSKGGLIYQSFVEPRSFLSGFLYGDMPKNSNMDCIVTELFFYEDIFGMSEKAKHFLKWAAESGTLCLNLNPYAIVRLKIVGSILNMNNEEIDECFDFLNNDKIAGDRYRLFLENCANPEWKNIDPRKNPLKSLNTSITFLEDYHGKTVTYLKNRKDNGMEWKNAQLLVDYSEEKIKLVRRLSDKIKNLSHNRLEEIEHDNNEKFKENKEKQEQEKQEQEKKEQEKKEQEKKEQEPKTPNKENEENKKTEI